MQEKVDNWWESESIRARVEKEIENASKELMCERVNDWLITEERGRKRENKWEKELIYILEFSSLLKNE